jgi:hypothetical protein
VPPLIWSNFTHQSSFIIGFDDVGGCKDVSPRGSTDGEFCGACLEVLFTSKIHLQFDSIRRLIGGGEEGGNSMELSPRDSIFKCLKGTFMYLNGNLQHHVRDDKF